MKEIAVLGSTGSIGTQTLDVIRSHPDLFHAQVLCANKSVEKLLRQAEEFHPAAVVVSDEEAGRKFKSLYAGPAEVIIGQEGLTEAALRDDVDLVLVAVVGIAGLAPTLAAIGAEKELALANKETLVAGGSLVLAEARKHHVLIRPVDSEHSAIFQCLNGENRSQLKKILLPASGGPFRGRKLEDLKNIQVEDALKHPNWSMGAKITIDSATLMNKGLEVIEAMRLYRLPVEQVDVVIHRQSIVHSLVEYRDGAMIAQLGTPDMKLPIRYAFTWPRRAPSPDRPLDLLTCGDLTFRAPDMDAFPCLRIARQRARTGGTACAIMNGANEAAVALFLQERVGFNDIPRLVESALSRVQVKYAPDLPDILEADRQARAAVLQTVGDMV